MGERVWAGQERCEALVATLPMPDPFTLEGFVAELGERLGRRIRLTSLPHASWLPCGLLVRTEDTDFVCYATATRGLHRELIVLHEIGHLLQLDEDDSTASGLGEDWAGAGEVDAATIQQLQKILPDLSPALIRRLLARTSYDDEVERAAEVFATLAAGRIAERRRYTDALYRDGWISPGLFELSTWRGSGRG